MHHKLNAVLALAALVLMAVVVYFHPADENAAEFENRNMEAFPEFTARGFLRGEFAKGFENFLLDNTGRRTSWLTFARVVERGYGVARGGGATVVVFDAADLGVGLVPAQLPRELAPGLAGDIHNEATGERVAVFTGGNVNPALPFGQDLQFHPDAVFYLRYVENRALAARYAEVLNAYARDIRAAQSQGALTENIRMFSVIAPVKVEFMGPRYAAVNSSQAGTIDFVNGLLDAEIIPVDAHGRLYAHSDEYIFFRLDHHWTMLGAYYAYLAWAEAAGLPPITIEHYIEHTIRGFVGSLAVGTRNRTVLAHPDTIHFYTLNDGTQFSIDMFVLPQEAAQLDYRVFLGGDRDMYYFTTSNRNGRTLVVVKDSFANAMIPWMAPHYETIVVIDPRQFGGSVLEELARHTDVDLVFINYIPATTMPDLIEQIYTAR